MSSDRSYNPKFATTHWSLVVAAGHENGSQAREALEDLCRRYWYPLYAWLRRDGLEHEDAQDAVQQFLLELIEYRRLDSADPQRGRFRTFLLTCLKNFAHNRRRAELALKRGGGVSPISLDFSQAAASWATEQCQELTADLLFDRKWALRLLEQSFEQLEASCRQRGKEELLAEVRPLLTCPASESNYSEIAERLKMSAGAVKVTLHRWREQLRQNIRDQIRQTVANDDEVDGELDYLFQVLTSPTQQ